MNQNDENNLELPAEVKRVLAGVSRQLAGERYPGRAWPASRRWRIVWPRVAVVLAAAAAVALAAGAWIVFSAGHRTHLPIQPAPLANATPAPTTHVAQLAKAAEPVPIRMLTNLDPGAGSDMPQDRQLLMLQVDPDLFFATAACASGTD